MFLRYLTTHLATPCLSLNRQFHILSSAQWGKMWTSPIWKRDPWLLSELNSIRTLYGEYLLCAWRPSVTVIPQKHIAARSVIDTLWGRDSRCLDRLSWGIDLILTDQLMKLKKGGFTLASPLYFYLFQPSLIGSTTCHPGRITRLRASLRSCTHILMPATW